MTDSNYPSVHEMCIKILSETSDGDDLAPQHLALIEICANNFHNESGLDALKEIYDQVISKSGYQKPWFHGIEYMTQDLEGFIYWKDKQVEHYSFRPENRDEEKEAAERLAKRCQWLEMMDYPVNTSTAIWRWEDYYGVNKPE